MIKRQSNDPRSTGKWLLVGQLSRISHGSVATHLSRGVSIIGSFITSLQFSLMMKEILKLSAFDEVRARV